MTRPVENITSRTVGDGEQAADVLFSIGDLATELEITTRAIRFYESRSLLQPQRIGGSRAYTRRDRARLMLILRAKRLGYSLDEISEYLSLYDVDETRVTQLRFLREKVESSMIELEAKRADIDSTLRELKQIRVAVLERLSAARKNRM